MDDEDIEETDFIEAILGKCWGGLDDPMMSIKNNAVLIAVHRQTLADYRSYFQLVVISLLLSVLVRQILQRWQECRNEAVMLGVFEGWSLLFHD